MNLKHHIFTIMSTLLAVWTFIGCEEEKEDLPQEIVYDHTLLIYIAGDNNLSSIAEGNLNDIGVGLLSYNEGLNLVVYKDNYNGLPALYRLKPSTSKIDTLYLARYVEQNSVDSEVMKEVITRTFSTYDTPVKGLLIWGHNSSWMPSPQYSVPISENGKQAAPANYGPDTNDYMELWEMRKTLEQVPYHLNYMIFDACYSSSAELAYCLRQETDYLLAAPTEVPGNGFPYSAMIPHLSRLQSPDETSIETTLSLVADEYVDLYPTMGAIALLRSSGMEGLLQAYLKLLAEHPDKLTAINRNPGGVAMQLQQYGRDAKGTRHIFFDIRSVASYLCDGEENNDYWTFRQSLDEAIAYYRYERYSLTNIDLSQCAGLSVSIPTMFVLNYANEAIYKAAYAETLWGKAILGK